MCRTTCPRLDDSTPTIGHQPGTDYRGEPRPVCACLLDNHLLGTPHDSSCPPGPGALPPVHTPHPTSFPHCRPTHSIVRTAAWLIQLLAVPPMCTAPPPQSTPPTLAPQELEHYCSMDIHSSGISSMATSDEARCLQVGVWATQQGAAIGFRGRHVGRPTHPAAGQLDAASASIGDCKTHTHQVIQSISVVLGDQHKLCRRMMPTVLPLKPPMLLPLVMPCPLELALPLMTPMPLTTPLPLVLMPPAFCR
jgi:hypothetical protein